MCGGTTYALRIAEALDGLSPRVRGNPLEFRNDSLASGSIPACAGEPG